MKKDYLFYISEPVTGNITYKKSCMAVRAKNVIDAWNMVVSNIEEDEKRKEWIIYDIKRL